MSILSRFFINPAPTLADPQAMNPALPFPDWQATGTPQPLPVAPSAAMFNKAAENAFPAQSLVLQPRRITVIA